MRTRQKSENEYKTDIFKSERLEWWMGLADAEEKMICKNIRLFDFNFK